MTQLKLHGDLSYCNIDGHLIFLDVQNDRYFRLTERLESALIAYLDRVNNRDSDVRTLIERKILVDGSNDFGHIPTAFKNVPKRSAMEEAARARRASVAEVLDTAAIVCSTQRQLKSCRLKKVLDGLASRRAKLTPGFPTSSDSESRAMDTAAAFRSARPYVPIDTCCLLDSIAMITFLAKRQLHADLVFGVTADPFSAHCWAQYGTTVLNDALGHALTYTPIRVI